MMMSYNSLVSGLQAKSVLANIHASLVQHDGWLTKENCEIFNMVLDDKNNAEWLAFEGAKDELYAEYKVDDAKLYMLLSYGLYFIKEEKFLNVLERNLPELVFEEMREIDWSKVSSKDFLDFWNKDKSRYYSSRLYKKLEDYKTDNAYAPFTESKLKGSVIKFTSCIDSYIKESILSFIEFGKQNIILGESDKEWDCVKGRKFDSIFLDCTRRMDSIMEDLNNAFLHLSDEGVIFVRTKRVQHDFVKYVVDHAMLEACFLSFYSTYILKKEGKVSETYIEQHESCNNYVGEKIHQNSISLSVLKDLNYHLNANAIECMLEYGEKGMSLGKFLTPYVFAEHNDKEGNVFCYKNFAKDYESVVIQPSDLDIDRIEKCRKIISPVLIMNTDKNAPKIVYVNASENLPVYVPYSYPIFSLNESIVCPEYIHYLCQKGTLATAMRKVRSTIASGYAYSYIISDNDLADVTWEEIFLHECDIVPIPSLPIQKQKIEDARLLQKVMDDKNRAKEALFNQKDSLYKEYIREVKHQLTNEMFPVANNIDLLRNFIDLSKDKIGATDKIVQFKNTTVKDVIDSIYNGFKVVEERLKLLTNDKSYNDYILKFNVVDYLQKYCSELRLKHPSYTIAFDYNEVFPVIKMSPTAFRDILDNIVWNAIRHGFVDSSRLDYMLLFSVKVENGNCCLSIANNGLPMTQRAKEIYTQRGKKAGDTGHDGLGGYTIFSNCELFNGKFHNIEGNDEFPVIISMDFPVLNL